MAVSVSVSVMAHPKRADMVKDLAWRIGEDVPVVWDRCDDEWDTGARAWEMHDRHASHHLVLQDDALPCAGLRAGLSHVLSEVPPNSPVSLYYGKLRPVRTVARIAHLKAQEMQASYIVGRQIFWGVGIILPTADIPQLLAWAQGRYEPYDRRISKWYEQRGIPVYYPHPSPVDHRGDDSILQHHARRRCHEHTAGELRYQRVTGPVVQL